MPPLFPGPQPFRAEPRGQDQRPRRATPIEAVTAEEVVAEVVEAVEEEVATTTTTRQCALPIPLTTDVTNNAIHPYIARLNLRPLDMYALPLGGTHADF